MDDPDEPKPSSFAAFGLDERLLPALAELGFVEPTPIQAAAMAPLLAGRDSIGRARTGSGKTAAFGLPLLHRILTQDAPPGVRALVLAPTRELALQVSAAIRSFASHARLRVATVYGGSAYGPQLAALRRGDPVLVGTPGRLIDHLERGSLDLSGIEMMVIDEADEMLRMGFVDDVERLLEATPAGRQVALFSATMPPPIRRIAKRFLTEPVIIEVEGETGPTVEHIQQRWLRVPDRFKLDALLRLLAGEERGAMLVFARTRQGCQEVAEALQARGLNADSLHGDMAQAARERTLNRLRDKSLDILVATDVAARGIDVEHLTHVVNLDFPENAETYTHRIGRTGRAGRAGMAITFVTPAQVRRLTYLRRDLNARIEPQPVPSDADIARRRRKEMEERLDAATPSAEAWLEELIEGDRTERDVALAALSLIAQKARIDLGDPDEQPPSWARPPERKRDYDNNSRGPARGGPGDSRDRFGAPDRGPRPDDRGPRPNDRGPRPNDRGPRPNDRGPRPDHRGPHSDGPPRGRSTNEVELFISLGRRAGVRPGDLVGALAGDRGISGSSIGRITIAEGKSFVGLSRDVAEHVLSAGNTLQVRGIDARVALANQRTDEPPQRAYGRKRGPAPQPHRKGGGAAYGGPNKRRRDSE